jgi:ketosteroid isomerase-like protein
VDIKPDIEKTNICFGPDSVNRLAEAADQTVCGALAALETFYYAWHHRDVDAVRAVWSASPLAQLNNPAGGIVRGGDAIAALYEKIFASPANLQMTFGDVIAYYGESHALFAGRETGSYTGPDGAPVPLEIRTSRYFRYADGLWRQYHQHGSIDDPDALRAYQHAVRA